MPRVFVNDFGVQGSPLSCQQFCPCFSQFFVPVDNESERTSQKYKLLKFGQRKIMVELFFWFQFKLQKIVYKIFYLQKSRKNISLKVGTHPGDRFKYPLKALTIFPWFNTFLWYTTVLLQERPGWGGTPNTFIFEYEHIENGGRGIVGRHASKNRNNRPPKYRSTFTCPWNSTRFIARWLSQ